jgi:hypothetical protein
MRETGVEMGCLGNGDGVVQARGIDAEAVHHDQ